MKMCYGSKGIIHHRPNYSVSCVHIVVPGETSGGAKNVLRRMEAFMGGSDSRTL